MKEATATEPVSPPKSFWATDAVVCWLVWLFSHLMYRVRVYGIEHIPKTAAPLLACNHVTWADGILLSIFIPRRIRLMADDANIKNWFINWLAKTMRVIPMRMAGGPKELVRTLRTANQALKEGDLVCIFPEGALTRTGQLLQFQRGLIRIVEGTGAPVIPVYLDGLWGSVFSYFGGKFFWKLPRRWPWPLAIHFGPPLQDPKDPFDVRQAILQLSVDAAEKRKQRQKTLPRACLRQCRRSLFRSKVADSTGQDLTGGQLLLRTLILKRVLERAFLAPDEKMVGVLLPPSAGAILANTALSFLRRVPVNLNYTFTSAELNTQLAACQIRHVLTSRKFMEKVNFTLNAEIIYLDEIAGKVGTADKLVAATQAYALPAILSERLLGLTAIGPDDVSTVIFTSGSTGEAKGVMLTYYNIASNIEAIDHLFNLTSRDVLMGVLPFFHSFGLTGTMWTVLALKPKGVYHFNPLDARVIGTLCEKHHVTIVMTTPTFLRSYLKRCEKSQLADVHLVVTGAEKLPADLAQAFEEKFGVRPKEGYGTTELSPLVSVNIADFKGPLFTQVGTKQGSVGQPVPGVLAKVVDPETGTDSGPDQSGLLLVKGPNVMLGYLNRPEKTAEVVHDGWYVTGDIAKIDPDGFIFITDRQSRFSKIGGEMVPHLKLEELLAKTLSRPEDEGPELRAVVTAIPDEKKGERLVVIHKPLSKSVEEVRHALTEAGLPNLWVPSADSFVEVDEIPVLGTGKLDLKGMKTLALKRLTALPQGALERNADK